MLYHPLPFRPKRMDSENRYLAIAKHISKSKNRTLLELCCSNGYFMFRFIQEGGSAAVGVEIDKNTVDLVNCISKVTGGGVTCYQAANVDEFPTIYKKRFDYGIYLDTHGATGTQGYLQYIKDHSTVSFISFAKQEPVCKLKLTKIFDSVEEIYQGYMDRVIYKCK